MSGVPILGEGGEADARSIPLATKSGKRLDNQRRQEHHPDRLRAAAQMWTSRFPGIRTRSLTATYNCVGMAFANRRTWVEPELLDRILDEDGYAQVAPTQDPESGDIIVYRKSPSDAVAHVGVVSRVEYLGSTRVVHVVSQWGADGEYFHREDQVPGVYGSHMLYFTDRKRP